MKILILGGSGMLGHKLTQQLKLKFEVIATIRGRYSQYAKYGIFEQSNVIENFDIESIENIEKVFEQTKPQIIINCIGIIKQLPSAKSVINCLKINALLPHQLGEIATRYGAKLYTISTDCVFDGANGMYTEEDFPDAKDIYGKTKNLGEVADGNHLTLRTSIIGRELATTHSFVEWFLSNQGGKVAGFAKAIYSGFPTVIFADIISDLILNHKDLRGLFHVSSEPINKYDLLVLIKKHFHADIEIEKDENFEIDRSLDSTKFREATGFKTRTWDEMIKIMAQDALQYSNWR